ncbi:ferrous iron transport protein B [bacterium]|nr:ferrous iron transport protein B [bacterium]
MKTGITKTITIALAGNPNTGKTTIFNNLTGARQHVGNYPGVTVEKKEGRCRHCGHDINIVDLPGTYSLSAYAVDELVARNYLVDERPELVVNIVDASNLERNLYLTMQIIELGLPVIIALNMTDTASKMRVKIDIKRLSELLGVPVVPCVGIRNEGSAELLDAILAVVLGKTHRQAAGVFYGDVIERQIYEISEALGVTEHISDIDRRWMSIKLLENDQQVFSKITSQDAVEHIEKACSSVNRRLGLSAEIAIADKRYSYIADICRQAVRSAPEVRRLSDRIDSILTNKYLGIPIFLAVMYLVFQLTFTLGAPPMDWIDAGFGRLADIISAFWPSGSESLLRSLLVDGVISGVGSVLIFLPNIMLLFIAIAILEDTGYMARTAFIMDRLMSRIGLHGKSFIPFIIGFGCSVPAIMATRTLENKRDRLLTMLVVPLISCGARLPIYALIIPAFFPQSLRTPMLWLIYIIGIVLAIGCAKLLSMTLFKGQAAPFVMELPPYHLPSAKSVLLHMWERSALYLAKAGTIILGVSILLWVCTSFPKKTTFDHDYVKLTIQAKQTLRGDALNNRLTQIADDQQAETMAYSVAGRLGHTIEPVLRPLGFDWRIGTALVGAIAAKEVFVAQLGIVFAVGEADETSGSLRTQLRKHYTPLNGFCIMLFCLISAPCMATFAITKRESNSWKWATFQFVGMTALAYVITLIVYQVGHILL